jgi:hypothetical protein
MGLWLLPFVAFSATHRSKWCCLAEDELAEAASFVLAKTRSRKIWIM